MRAGAAPIALVLVLAACGQRGDLYLPASTKTEVPPVLAGAAPAATTSPPTRPVAQFVDVSGTSLRYQLLGNGPSTVVLPNEMGAAPGAWDSVVDELSRDHRVLRYDLRGFGQSATIDGEVRMSDEVADLGGLLDALQIRGPVTLIGGAVGGAVALQFAAAHPDRVQAVFAISPAIGVAPTGALQASTDAASRAATQRMVAATTWNEVWPRLQCPVWVVAARPYAAQPADSLQAMVNGIPGGRGHFEALDTSQVTAIESPGLLSPLLRRFLSQTAH